MIEGLEVMERIIRLLSVERQATKAVLSQEMYGSIFHSFSV
jgi:hypothetical protein